MACNSWAKRLLFILCWRGVCSTTGGRSCICHPVGLVLLTSAIASPRARSEVHWSMCADAQLVTEPAAPAGVESLVLRLGQRSRGSAARSGLYQRQSRMVPSWLGGCCRANAARNPVCRSISWVNASREWLANGRAIGGFIHDARWAQSLCRRGIDRASSGLGIRWQFVGLRGIHWGF